MNSFLILQIVSVLLVAVAYALPAEERPIAILRQVQDASPDGSYQFSFETENGISHEESGAPKQINDETPVVVQGQYQYTDNDGNPIALSYTADENGFQPQGAHLPVAPPIPEAIQRSLEWNAAHPEQENRPSRF